MLPSSLLSDTLSPVSNLTSVLFFNSFLCRSYTLLFDTFSAMTTCTRNSATQTDTNTFSTANETSSCVLKGLMAQNAHLSECERVVEVQAGVPCMLRGVFSCTCCEISAYLLCLHQGHRCRTSDNSCEVLIVCKLPAHLLAVTS